MPLVVKFADTQKEKEQKKAQQQLTALGIASGPATSPVAPQSQSQTPNLNSSYLAVRGG